MKKMKYKTNVYDFGRYKPKDGETNHWFIYITEQDIYEEEYPSPMTWEVYIKLSNFCHICRIGWFPTAKYTEEEVLEEIEANFQEYAEKYLTEVMERDLVNHIKNPWMYEEDCEE